MCQEGTGPRWVSGVGVTGVWQATNMRSTGDRDETTTGDDGPSGGGGAVRVDRFGEPVFTPPGEVAAALAGLAELAGVDVRALDDDSCLGLFDALEVADRLFHSTRFGLLAELHARDLTDRRLGHVVANEAAWRHGVDQRRVRRDVATANMLRRLPVVADALRDGTVSVDRVREVCRHVNDRSLDTFTSIQHELLDLMRAPSTWTAFTRDITQLASYADHDGVEPPRPRNHAAITRSGDTLAATIDVYGPESIGFEQRLNTEADRLFRQAVTDHNIDPTLEIPPRSELLAQAFINLVERGATAAASSSGRAPAADVTVVVDVDEATVADLFHDGILLPGPRDGAAVDWSHRVRDVTGARLRYSSREWELLTCDPTIAWVIVAAGGQPVACKADERHANRAQRRALAVRDGGCVFPGCEAPPNWCDAHHVKHHHDGGATNIDNLVLLCRHHHGVIHRDGWMMSVATDPHARGGHFEITTCDGATLPTQHRPTQHRHTPHRRPPHEQRPPHERPPAPA